MVAEVPKSIANRWEVNKKLGEGSFGQVFRGVDTKTNSEVAIKFEEAGTAGLKNEAELLDKLRRPFQRHGFAEVYHYSKLNRKWNVMVMELLGKSLEDCMEECGKAGALRFKPGTTASVAGQILHRIEYLHSKGIVHRDIKPENFMWGIGRKIHHLYLIDFGLSVKYYDKKHVKMSSFASLTGTARYASVNAHKGCTQSRRDDLEGIAHMLIYFLRGSLPWSGLKAKTQEEKFRKIMETKAMYPLEKLCEGYPKEFEIFLRTARNMKFEERPNYAALQKMFKDVREDQGIKEDWELEWLHGKDIDFKSLIPMDPGVGHRQPDDCGPGGRHSVMSQQSGGLGAFGAAAASVYKRVRCRASRGSDPEGLLSAGGSGNEPPTASSKSRMDTE
mmetsp:Transcript_83809/g.242042  ORF Transcript_83809/g.242042 Transcript_83809/m.242042 type:complete len:389 (+) Transcript_83809:109-1275(+)